MFRYEFAKQVMRERGFTMEHVAKLAGIGKRSLSQYLNGHAMPGRRTIIYLAGVLQIPVGDLVDDDSVLSFSQKVKAN